VLAGVLIEVDQFGGLANGGKGRFLAAPAERRMRSPFL
jgi:hypothetical protein